MPTIEELPATLMAGADAALYQTKSLGRDAIAVRVCVASRTEATILSSSILS